MDKQKKEVFPASLLPSFYKQELGASHVPSTVLALGSQQWTKQTTPALMERMFLSGWTINQQIYKLMSGGHKLSDGKQSRVRGGTDRKGVH